MTCDATREEMTESEVEEGVAFRAMTLHDKAVKAYLDREILREREREREKWQ